MPKGSKRSKPADVDIFQLSSESFGKRRQKRRKALLATLGVQEFFVEGTISIDKRTCRGLECNLCTKVCPTDALYWKFGEIGVTRELCVFCGACVLSCIVDDCIRIVRERSNGEIESFSNLRDFLALQDRVNARRRFARIDEIKDLLPKPEDYRKRRKKKNGKA